MALNDVKEIIIPEGSVATTSQIFSSTLNTSTLTWFNYYPTSNANLGACKVLRIRGKCYVYQGTYSWSGLYYSSDIYGNIAQITLNTTDSGWAETSFDINCYLTSDTEVSGCWTVLHLGGQTGNSWRWIRPVVSKTNNTNLDIYTSSNTASELFKLEIDSVDIGVSKIEDSNGNIIWGSQSAFPYRRLEYIHFSGAERIDTKMKPQNHFYFLNCKIQKRTDTWTLIWGAAHKVNNTVFRLFWQGNTNGSLNPRLKDTNTDFVSNTENKIVQLRLRNYSTNNTSGTYWWACQDLNGNGLSDGTESTQMMGKFYNSSTYACNFNNFNTTIAIGQYHNNGSWISAGAQPIMNVYRYFIKDTDGDSAISNDQYPCQRKSDGVCGLYDIKTNTFYPMEGTNITTNAAGPIADEYWDLTAPA